MNLASNDQQGPDVNNMREYNTPDVLNILSCYMLIIFSDIKELDERLNVDT